jgi:hypothetical protein
MLADLEPEKNLCFSTVFCLLTTDLSCVTLLYG